MEDNRKKGEILVEVEGLSKKFCKDLKTSLWYGLKDIFSNIKGNRSENNLRPKEFWAVKDISFQLRRGECLGLIGHNGAGKSTLLKMLNGLINPDEGKITMRGRVGALIELGAGFNPILTGRENIYNNGAVLGFTRAEINDKMQAIIDFCEIEEFLDMPVQNYSSGMKVRLGFAVAAQMEPDILIIDEVLAVGDLGFILKCFKTIDEILPKTAVVFVSHSMPMISRVCTHAILMEKGEPKYQGDSVSKAIDIYYKRFISNDDLIVYDEKKIKLRKIFSKSGNISKGINQVNWGDELVLHFDFELLEEMNMPKFHIIILDKEQRPVALLERNTELDSLKQNNNEICFDAVLKNLQLSKGVYSLNLAVTEMKSNRQILRQHNIFSFQVVHERETWEPFLLKTEYIAD